jgi:hypothetical protein
VRVGRLRLWSWMRLWLKGRGCKQDGGEGESKFRWWLFSEGMAGGCKRRFGLMLTKFGEIGGWWYVWEVVGNGGMGNGEWEKGKSLDHNYKNYVWKVAWSPSCQVLVKVVKSGKSRL